MHMVAVLILSTTLPVLGSRLTAALMSRFVARSARAVLLPLCGQRSRFGEDGVTLLQYTRVAYSHPCHPLAASAPAMPPAGPDFLDFLLTVLLSLFLRSREKAPLIEPASDGRRGLPSAAVAAAGTSVGLSKALLEALLPIP